jgi:putative SOS response-associated peptidase YedK
MCGRFTLRTDPQQLALRFGCEVPADLAPRYNIAPTQPVAAVRIGPASDRQFALFRWGLIPSWAKDASIGNRLINARAESVAEKPAFRAAFRRRRCLILADGFYEWKKTGRAKQPYFIRMPHEQPFAFAGLWETWRDPESGEPIESCTIITTEASPEMAGIHERMPVILDDDSYPLWIDPGQNDPQRLQPLLRPWDRQALITDPVDSRVNNPRNEGVECISVRKNE